MRALAAQLRLRLPVPRAQFYQQAAVEDRTRGTPLERLPPQRRWAHQSQQFAADRGRTGGK
tara:strand:+ start:616 stop:798 length:183 start_codon:yes stop_codon:yes gene_type:complete